MGKLNTRKVVDKYPLSFESPFWWIDYSSAASAPRPIPVPGNFLLLEDGMEIQVSDQEFDHYKVGDMYTYEGESNGWFCLALVVGLISFLVISGIITAFLLQRLV